MSTFKFKSLMSLVLVLNFVSAPVFAAVDKTEAAELSATSAAEETFVPRSIYVDPRSGLVLVLQNGCDSILNHKKPALANRVTKVLISLMYDEVVRALFYSNSVAPADRDADEAVVRFSKESTQELKINLARLRSMKQMFLAVTGNPLELVDVVLAHRKGSTYQPLYSIIASVITYTPRESGWLDREFALVGSIVEEGIALDAKLAAIASNKRLSDKTATIRKEEAMASTSEQFQVISKLHQDLWHHGLHMSTVENTPPMLLATAAMFYGQPGIGALANLKIKK